ncbi:hypothetical protein INR49_022538 [Caranx melampygus]|nr:hypothetical protein INR49_022538 [Caranx melampygus]
MPSNGTRISMARPVCTVARCSASSFITKQRQHYAGLVLTEAAGTDGRHETNSMCQVDHVDHVLESLLQGQVLLQTGPPSCYQLLQQTPLSEDVLLTSQDTTDVIVSLCLHLSCKLHYHSNSLFIRCNVRLNGLVFLHCCLNCWKS